VKSIVHEKKKIYDSCVVEFLVFLNLIFLFLVLVSYLYFSTF
jgi:hypothetical protein